MSEARLQNEGAMPQEKVEYPVLSDDRPIQSMAKDRLGRRPFAEAIAGAVRRWRDRESIVIAIYGRWGAGKSSVKNMVLESLATGDPAVRVAEFNPWRFANRDQLSQAFFEQVGIQVGRKGPERRSTLAIHWRRYAAYLRTGADIAGLLRTPASLLLAVVAVIVSGVGLASAPYIALVAGGAFAVLAGLLRWSSRFADAVQRFLSARFTGNEQTLEDVRAELTAALRRLEAPLLVVLDDIDRLTPDETMEMLQLVKANADFPNVVYLMLCDRPTVETNIGSALSTQDGRAYLEKIVQVGFDLPVIEETRLQKVLCAGLDTLLSDEEVGKRFDQRRWGNVFLGGLAPYFTDLRQVNRFLSTFAFHVGVFRGRAAFEVNPVDLIALEALRMFEPVVYQRVAVNKDLLTDLHDRGHNDDARAILNGLVEASSPEHREHVKEILRQLFPPAEWAWGGPGYGADFEEGWFRELRVCSPDAFDRYFVLATPEGDLSEAELSRLLSSVSDRERFRAELRALAEKGLLGVALDRMEAYKQRIDVAHALPLVTGLMDVSELISSEHKGMLAFSDQTHASRIIRWYLLKDDFTEAQRAEILKTAVQDTLGLSLPVRIVSVELQGHADAGGSTLVSLADAEALKALCVEKIRAAAESGELLGSKDLSHLLVLWREWDDRERVREYCVGAAGTRAEAFRLLEAFLQRSTSHAIGEHVEQVHWYMKLSVVEEFVPAETLRRTLAGVSDAELTANQAKAVGAFREALKRRSEGKPERDFFRDDED